MSSIEIIPDFAQDLLDTAHSMILEFGRPDVQSKFITVGEPVWDADHCGQLTVSLTTLRPSEAFPIPMATAPLVAAPPVMMTYFNVELVRCFPTIDDNGKPPDDGVISAVSAGVMIDLQLLWNSVMCSIRRWDQQSDVEVAVTDGIIVGPNGGAVAARIELVMGLQDPCPCSQISAGGIQTDQL